MGRKSRLAVIKPTLLEFFQRSPRKVFTHSDIYQILSDNRELWQLPENVTANKFRNFLATEGELKEITLKSDHYLNAKLERYVWGIPSPYEVAASLKKSAYLSHATAVFLHGLTDLVPKTIYVNMEQSPKPPPNGALSPTAIKSAFARKQRQSKLSYQYDNWALVVINGKSTNRLGVIKVQGPTGEELSATSLERTLIDIVVRPSYSGGIFKVLDAYRTAKDQVSISSLVTILKQLNYVYPYHQSIGFLMQRSGYSKHQYEMLRDDVKGFVIQHDFYLTHGMVRPKYDASWKLYFPDGI